MIVRKTTGTTLTPDQKMIRVGLSMANYKMLLKLKGMTQSVFVVRIFSLLSAILHLGNIRYKKKAYRDDSIDICNPEVLPIVSELLEVSSSLRFFPSFYANSRCLENPKVISG